MIKKAALAVIDCRIDDTIKDSLLGFTENIALLPPYASLAAPIASHPDMLIWNYNGTIFTPSDYFSKNVDFFSVFTELGYNVSITDDCLYSDYPRDVAFNCVKMGKFILANTRAISPHIRAITEKNGLSIVHVNQGYAKCSTVSLSDNAAITADSSIHTAMKSCGIDCLLISKYGVSLSGYDCGFIGGASGVYRNKVFFCGDLLTHPDGEKISNFCKKHKKTVISLSSNPLYDYGTIMFFDKIK